ncbi:hypothetical protein [Streptomyces sp. NBC_01538]|uniref:hypothetical protein n=1 Tax=Streptomyces sp. NBC_01538 TaxID=2903897 RepID=UPI003865A3D4
MVGRVVAALCHGAFFSVGAVVASGMVAENKKGSAIALVFGGLTAANVLGAGIGGLTLGAGYSFVSPLWVGAALAVAGLGVAVAGARGGSPSGSRAAAPGVAGRAENGGAGGVRL